MILVLAANSTQFNDSCAVRAVARPSGCEAKSSPNQIALSLGLRPRSRAKENKTPVHACFGRDDWHRVAGLLGLRKLVLERMGGNLLYRCNPYNVAHIPPMSGSTFCLDLLQNSEIQSRVGSATWLRTLQGRPSSHCIQLFCGDKFRIDQGCRRPEGCRRIGRSSCDIELVVHKQACGPAKTAITSVPNMPALTSPNQNRE